MGHPIATDGTPDVWPFYFNEPLSSDAAPIDKIMDESTLNFRDSARFHAFGANQYVGFDTQLVGVNLVNGSYISVPLNGTDIEFLWTTNATMANGGIIQNDYTRTFDSDNLPALASGGVIDVAYTTPLTFSPIANPTVMQGDAVTFNATASDPRSGAVLTYSLAPGFPPGAAIDPSDGAFTWNVPASEPPGDYLVTVVAEDNTNPPLSNTTSVVIQVAPGAQPTILLDVSGRGTYGGTGALTSTLSAGGSPVVGETITFDLDKQGIVSLIGTATTDASGIATLSGVSVAGYGAGVYSAL